MIVSSLTPVIVAKELQVIPNFNYFCSNIVCCRKCIFLNRYILIDINKKYIFTFSADKIIYLKQNSPIHIK